MIHAVIATARGGAIGFKGALPWPTIREDMLQFRHLTIPHCVIMGRKTWESLPEKYRPLPGRMNVVVSRTLTELDGAFVVSSVEEALGLAETKRRRPFVIGGAAIYEAARVYIDVWHVSEIDRDVKADVRFLVPDVPVTEVEESGVEGITFVTRKRAA